MSEQINLNTARAETLTRLPGIGPGLARRIDEYRRTVGRFRSVRELAAVAGVTDRIVDALGDRISVEDAAVGEETDFPSTEIQVTLKTGDYSGCRMRVAYTTRETLEAGHGTSSSVLVPGETSVDVPANGEFSLTIPNRKDLQGDTTFTLVAPDGEILGTRVFQAPSEIPSELVWEVKPKKFPKPQPNLDPSAGKPTRLKGRVIDEDGQMQLARRQVVVWAVQTDDPEDADFRALFVAETDGNGYFGGPYPTGSFTAAAGAVSVGEEPIRVPIHLQEDGTFPESVILVVGLDEVAEEGEEPCCKGKGVPRDPDASDLARADGTFSDDPGAGRCVDFTKPDRTLEEFGYSYVVRTTEPAIKGLTLEEPRKVDISEITRFLAAAKAGESSGLTTVQPRMMVAELPRGVPSGSVESGSGNETPMEARSVASAKIDANIMHTLARDPDGFTLTRVAQAAQLTAHGDLLRHLGKYLKLRPGRTRLTCENPLDWDDEPTIYQACTIAHGHVLRFKQEWVADGYSMGNLLYSLPLAPGQKKQIAVVDWERREATARTEALEEEEAIQASISRDRDVNEIVTGTVRENVRGGSRSSAGSFAGGLGIGGIIGSFGGLLGIGGGTSSASSSAWQRSSRNTSASALNQLRDRTIQSASSLRSQRSTVVQTVRQGERVVATTESVANYNHCHAITIQYFEVLRHLLVRQRLVDVQECLFVPLLMSRFTSEKTLRWKDTLSPYVRSRRLRKGFDALDRISADYAGSDLPEGRYADESLEHAEGGLHLRFELARPKDKEDDFDPDRWSWFGHLFPFITASELYKTHLKNQELKDKIFQEEIAPRIARRFVQHMQFFAVDQSDNRHPMPLDATLVSDYASDRPLYVSLRPAGDLPPLKRSDIKYFEISDLSGEVGLPWFQLLPTGSRVVVERGTLRYRTRCASDVLFRNSRVDDDLVGGDRVRIFTPLNRREIRNPREEDKEVARQLLDHLNENLERYHHVIWWRMSPDRRYMLLDGFQAPNAGGRSVASVVENELIGIVGNTLILPVARGFHLDPTFNQDVEDPVDLLEHYQPNTPIEPMRVAVPTRGVYAEAVMGACNSCEMKEEERFWRWEESPIPDSPSSILPISTESRRATPPDMEAKDFPSPMISLQNAPAAPDPTGVGAALQLLGTSGIFKDITGLEGTQKNALAALQKAFGTAEFFGGKAADLALQGKMARDADKAMRTIQKAKEKNLITDDQAKELAGSTIRGMIGGGADKAKSSLSQQPEIKKLLESSDDKPGESKVRLERQEGGTSEAVDISRATSGLASLFGAGSKPATIGKRSTKAEALARIQVCRASTAISPWTLDREAMLDRLAELVNNPNPVNQDGLNLCGPAAFLRLWIARDPLAVVEFACTLYDEGKAAINHYKVEPDSDSLLAEDYAALDAANDNFIPPAEWMICGALRDAENFFFDFEGKPEEDVSAGTGPGELAEWFEATNLYGEITNDGNFFLTRSVAHALDLKPGNACDVALLINAHMLKQMNVKEGTQKSDDFILNAFPNHFIVLTAPIQETEDGKLFVQYWTWGQPYRGVIEKDIFESNYYGAVICKGAAE